MTSIGSFPTRRTGEPARICRKWDRAEPRPARASVNIKPMPGDHTPQRVVCLQPSATVILAAIGKLDRVVACTKYCADVCPEVAASGCAIVADSWTAKSEDIL